MCIGQDGKAVSQQFKDKLNINFITHLLRSKIWGHVVYVSGFGFLVDEHGNMLKKPQVGDLNVCLFVCVCVCFSNLSF